MKAGFNMLLWTGHVTEEDFPRLEMLKKALMVWKFRFSVVTWHILKKLAR